MKKCFILLSFFLSALLFSGEILFDSGDTRKGLWDSNQQVTEDGSARVNGNALLMSKNFYPVSPDKSYRLTGQFMAATPKTGKFFFGFVPFDADRKRIELHHVNALYQTETELAAPCIPKDRVLTVRNAMNWKTDPYLYIAFNAKDDFSDLPNRNLSSRGIEKIEKADGSWKITLKTPCGMEYPAGTKVRLQRQGSQFICNGAFSRNPGKEWDSCTNQINGLSKKGESRTQFWAGTRFVKVVILGNYLCKEDVGLLFRNIKFEQLD